MENNVVMTRAEIEKSFQYNMTNAFIEWDKAVNTEYNEDNEKAFYEGAYAAQKYLIDKMNKFFDEHIYDDAYWTCDDEFMLCRFIDDLEKNLKRIIMKLWIAREPDNLDLYLYDTKPYIDERDWNSTGNHYLIDEDLFPEVTFENSPQEVEIKLVDNYDGKTS